MKKGLEQTAICWNELSLFGVSKGARLFLRQTRISHTRLYENYPLHSRINMKANTLSATCVIGGSNRYTICSHAKNTANLDYYYESIRINRFDAYHYLSEESINQLKDKRKHYDKIYAILMKTVGKKQERERMLNEYINNGYYYTQTEIK